MNLRKPKNGDCKSCRWFEKDTTAQFDRCYALPKGTTTRPFRVCSYFEPPEGKVCGTCEHRISMMEGDASPDCDIDGIPHSAYYTCLSWRWGGKEE